MAANDEYPRPIMIGGRIETGVAPSAARRVPKPTLMIMI
ncbi:MAG: hypothetical protein BWY06_01170 [Candidatus Latescibacteria bacterium ADurb.Bin168]|nr:MAG: hypothetical protein BWY06_01170 [Candidatus Latescibacteria bacterium ADurb.Bin168]